MAEYATSPGEHSLPGALSSSATRHREQIVAAPNSDQKTREMSSKRQLTSHNMEIAAMFHHLVENNGPHSADVLRSLRKMLKKGNGQLPEGDRTAYFTAFYHLLVDIRWKMVCETTMLMVDIIPQMNDFELDSCMAIVLPRVVNNLGHESTDVRRASLRLLHVYMRYTNNLQKVLRTYVQHGLESIEKPAQKGAVLSLPLLFTEEFSNENLFPLVQSLGELLVNSDTTLFYPVFLAIQRLHVLVGNDAFKLYLDHVTPEARMLYQRVLSRNSTANSGGRSETGNMFENSSEENNNDGPGISMDKLITCGDIPKPIVDSVDAVAGSFDSMSVETSLYGNVSNDYGFNFEYALFPRPIVNRAMSDKFPEKIEGLNQVLTIIRESSMSQLAVFSSHLDDFLSRFLQKQLEDANFKVNLFGLDIVHHISERLKVNAINYMRPMVAMVFKRMGDSRVVVREHAIKTVHALMFSFPPQHVLDALVEQKYHRNPKVREELINRVTGALLTFPRSEFNLPKLCYEIAPLLVDNKRMVRLAALECLAVIAQALGHQHLSPLYGAVQTVESTCDAEGLFNAVQARLARRDLPRCHSDGAIRYVLNPTTFSGWFPSDADADIEWVMLASSSNSGTPPKFPSLNQPQHNAQRGRRKSNFSIKGAHPQVSFEQTDFSSDNGFRTDGETTQRSTFNMDVMPAYSTFPEAGTSHAKGSDRGISTSSSSGSLRSDDSKGRELWRYYFRKFKQHVTGTTSSAGTVDRSRTASYPKLPDPQARHQPSMRRSLSSSSSASGEFTDRNHHSFEEGKLAPEPMLPEVGGLLSDISERSNEGSTRARAGAKRTIKPPSSVPSTPDRKPSLDVRFEMRSKSVSERQKTPSPNRAHLEVATDCGGQQQASSPGHDAPVNNASRAESVAAPGKRSPSPTKRLQDASSAPTTRPSTPNSAPATPIPSDNPDIPIGLRRQSLVTGSMPAICLLPQTSDGPPAQQGGSGGEMAGRSPVDAHMDHDGQNAGTRDAQTQKDDSELSTASTSETGGSDMLAMRKGAPPKAVPSRHRLAGRKRISRSISPNPKSRHHGSQLTRLQPAIPANANIRSILENVAKTEGSFTNPEDALKAAIAAFTQDTWTTKVEGMLAITRLATFHPQTLQKEMRTIIGALVYEVKNLRSSVARSAIFTLGELFVKMKKQVEPDMDAMGQALLHKCGENVTFIRDDIDIALTNMIEEMPQTKSAITLITNGANHRIMSVRRTTAHYLSSLVEKMGANKCLMGPRDIGEHLLPATARFVMDGSPHTRYYGRKIFSILLPHPFFDKFLRKYLSPGTFRNIVGILESIKRRGIGDVPPDLPAKGI